MEIMVFYSTRIGFITNLADDVYFTAKSGHFIFLGPGFMDCEKNMSEKRKFRFLNLKNTQPKR